VACFRFCGGGGEGSHGHSSRPDFTSTVGRLKHIFLLFEGQTRTPLPATGRGTVKAKVKGTSNRK
jgi:hypothetical protein